MATKSLPGILLALITAAAIIPAALALEASPNSPCAPLCVDSRGLNQSDPSSFSTVGADIKCTDEDIQTTAQGEKFQQCVGCLQGSTYSGGGQNDQAWFVCMWRSIPVSRYMFAGGVLTWSSLSQQITCSILSTTASLATPMPPALSRAPASRPRRVVRLLIP